MLSLLLASATAPASPAIVLTRLQAEAMSAEQLAQLVLADFPHDVITSANVPDDRPGQHGELSDPSLGYISFEERGRAAPGGLCTARRIVATFDWPDGGIGKPLADRSAGDAKRLFHVGTHPKVAVLGQSTTDARCAALPAARYAQLSPSPEHERRLRQFRDLTEAFAAGRKLAVPVQCGDWRGAEEKPCRGDQVLAKIDWARLFSVQPVDWPHGVPATLMTFSQSEGPLIQAYLSGTGAIDAVKLTYAWPAPF